MKAGLSATSRKPDLVRNDDHRHPVLGESAHHVEDVADELGVERRLGSSKSIGLGFITRARAIATRCYWPPESCAG